MGGNFNNNLVEFVDQLISEKGDALDEVSLADEKARLLDLLNDDLNNAMVGALPEDKAAELERLLDEKGDDATENEITAVIYSSQNLINEAVEKTMSAFRENYLKGEI